MFVPIRNLKTPCSAEEVEQLEEMFENMFYGLPPPSAPLQSLATQVSSQTGSLFRAQHDSALVSAGAVRFVRIGGSANPRQLERVEETFVMEPFTPGWVSASKKTSTVRRRTLKNVPPIRRTVTLIPPQQLMEMAAAAAPPISRPDAKTSRQEEPSEPNDPSPFALKRTRSMLVSIWV